MQKLARAVFFVTVVLRSGVTAGNDSCGKEWSRGDGRLIFIWNSTSQDGNYESRPRCFDLEGNIVKRRCYGGQWHPSQPPLCRSSRCPKHFTFTNSYCLYITEPKTYESGCLNIDETSTGGHSTSNYRWYPITRKVKFGPFEYDAPGNTYGKFVQNMGDLDCMVTQVNASSLVNVNCSSLYSHACPYRETILPSQLFAPMQMELKFDRLNHKMFLIVYSPELLLTIKHGYDEHDDDDDDDDENDGGEAVYCFTNAKGNLKEKVDIKKVYDSRKSTDENRRTNFAVYKLDLEEEPGQYWCEAFTTDNGKLMSSNIVIGYETKRGNEYALRVVLKNICAFTNCTKAFAYYKDLEKFCKEIHVRCRLMEIFNLSDMESDILVHVSSRDQRNVIREYYKIKRKFQEVNIRFMNVVYFKSSDVCLPDTTITGEKKLSWQMTPLGSMTRPKEFCLNRNGLFITRSCEGSFLYGAEWSHLTDECSDDIEMSPITQYLYNAVSQNLTEFTLEKLSLATNKSQEFSAVDLSLVADGLYQISLQNINTNLIRDFTKSVSNIINANISMLRRAQLFLNSTDRILDATENFLDKLGTENLTTNYLKIIRKRNFMIHITKPFRNNITGVALYGNSDNTFLDYNISNIYANNSVGDLDFDNLEVAVFVPYDLLQSLSFNLTETAKEKISIITTIFFNDNLFNQNKTTMHAQGKVVGVTIPGFGTYLETPLPLFFRSLQRTSKTDCAYWNYGHDSQTKQGQWSMQGENYLEQFDNDTHVSCAFSHLTHFALLILSERVIVTEEAGGVITTVSAHSKHELDLTIITAVGCLLSFIGILGIFLTAIMFKKWREKIGTRILLQLSVTIILEIITTQVAGLENWLDHKIICTIIGALLQYIVLSQFSWMLVVAYLQYLRFVKIVGSMPSRLLLKSMLMGWLLPLVPVLLSVIISPSSYSAGYQKFCYPKGMALYLGLITPAAATVAANILIFSVIMHNISNSKAKLYTKSNRTHKLQMYLAVLLFFMLGIHWIFGIMAEVLSHSWMEIVFIYLFCLTATLQGFVLFVFYVILDKDTRLLWVAHIKSYY